MAIPANTEELIAALRSLLAAPYPAIQIQAKPFEADPRRLALYFIDAKFSLLYPWQRYHCLKHSIPKEFYDQHLADTVWFELAPGEAVGDLRHPDAEEFRTIAPDVLRVIERAGVFAALDDLLAPECAEDPSVPCHGDFRNTKLVLAEKGFGRRGEIDEVYDVCHVLMIRGAFCDCEVLYNVSDTNRLKTRYWTSSRQENS